MSRALTREEALRTLRLRADAATADVKRAYRRLAREHHPDLGGDPETFARLHRAYERLVADNGHPTPPPVQRGRPSRPPRTVVSDAPPEVDELDWSPLRLDGDRSLDRQRLARLLAQDHGGPVHPLTATSRAPGSRLNRFAAALASDLTSRLTVGPARDDRDRLVVAAEVRGANRRARRALDRVALDGVWVRTRTSTSTTLRWTTEPYPDRRATSVQVADRIEGLLEAMVWPLRTWTVTSAWRDEATGG